MPSASRLQNVHNTLQLWYREHGRHDLPWRLTNDPYRIWISEIMLQQTQVKTVLERFYFPFLETFPTLADLAAADLDEVLKKWEGLGYYTRARNLHRAAQQCVTALPQSVHELQALPGIGKSTAHAIAAFAYKTPVPILDANVKRILYRFFTLEKAGEKELWEAAWKLFDTGHPFEFNQAMMDIGSTLCLPKNAQCALCPLSLTCKAAKTDPLRYPAARIKKAVPIRRRCIHVYRHQKRYALQQRGTKFLHGLWGFYETDFPCDTSGTPLGSIIQKYSHFHLHADVYLHTLEIADALWFERSEIASLALSGADHKVLALLEAFESSESYM